MPLGARIRHYRIKRGWTLEQLSERSRVDVGTISALEKRDSRRSEFAASLAGALDLTVEELLDEQHDYAPGFAAVRSTVLRAEEPRFSVTETDTGQRDAWPFPGIDPAKIRRLRFDDVLRLEGALLTVALSFGLDIRRT